MVEGYQSKNGVRAEIKLLGAGSKMWLLVRDFKDVAVRSFVETSVK